MNLWTFWLDTLRGLVDTLSSDVGLGFGLAIITATLLLRVLLLPISWSAAYRGCIRQKKMMKLQPELQQLRDEYATKPDVYMQQVTALYRKHESSFIDGKSLLGGLAQIPLFLGMFQALRNAGDGVRFLWVSNLLRPDTLFALVAGATTALMIVANPDIPEQMRLFLIIVPSVFAIMAALKFCSALSLYWVASNCFSAVQTMALHFVVARRLRAGTLKI
ncbi:MAG TPA: membrane protein insertase YidC [Povalibacter sp.]